MMNRRKFFKLAATGALSVFGSGVVPTTWNKIAMADSNKFADQYTDTNALIGLKTVKVICDVNLGDPKRLYKHCRVSEQRLCIAADGLR